MRLPYQLHGGLLLPMCEVQIIGRNSFAFVNAVIDSGAFRPIFLKSSAVDAGLSLDSGRPEGVTFGGSSTIGRLITTDVLIDNSRFRLDILYVDDLKVPYALLGRATFFNQFNEVAFHERSLKKAVHFRG